MEAAVEGISIIIPVLNEENLIEKTITQFTGHSFSNRLEVIVIDGGSTDKTIDIVTRLLVTLLHSPIKSRAAQMNLGAKAARYPLLYFVHADVKVPPTFFEDLTESIRLGFACGCYRSDYERYPGLMKINAYVTRFSSLTFRGGDQTLFITQELFQVLNGFDEHFTIMEDYNILERIKKQKARFRLLEKSVIISVRKYENNSWLRVQYANAIAMWMYRSRKPPEEIKQRYQQLLL